MGVCPKCNADYGERTPKFCPSCGANIEQEEPKPAQASSASCAQTGEQTQSKSQTAEAPQSKAQANAPKAAPVAAVIDQADSGNRKEEAPKAPLASVIGQNAASVEKPGEKKSKGTAGIVIIIVAVIVVAIIAGVAIFGHASSSKDYTLDQRDYMNEEWGTTSFEVDSSWELIDGDFETIGEANHFYLSNSDEFYLVDIYSYDPNSEFSLSEYEWREEVEDVHDDGCTLDKTGTMKVDGHECELFTITDSEDPDDEDATTDYYGVIKDGEVDFVLYTNDKDLRKDVLKTVEFD